MITVERDNNAWSIYVSDDVDAQQWGAWARDLAELTDHCPAEAILYDSRNRIFRTDFADQACVVKSFPHTRFKQKALYLWRSSKACRSFAYAERLLNLGIKTPAPLCCAELRHNGILRRSFYVSALSDAQSDMRAKQKVGQQHPYIESYAQWLALLHRKGVFHKDFTPGNTLIDEHGEAPVFSLIDLNRIRFFKHGVPWKARVFNIMQTELEGELLQRFLQSYADESGQSVSRLIRALKWRTFWFKLHWAYKRKTRKYRRALGM